MMKMKESTQKYLTIAVMVAAVLVGPQLFIFSSDDHNDADQTFQSKFNEDYRIYSLNIPDNLTFCGEKVPTIDEDVRERLDRELLVNTYWQSNSMLYHKRASKWFPVIEPILKANGIPDDFKYLALVESGLTNTVSPAGAAGFWQLLKTTAPEYGLEVNDEVDERYDVRKCTEAACKYLKEAHDRYGNWTLAAASYNMGMNGLNKQLDRQQVDHYYDLLLNDETSRYVFRIIAAKQIIEHPTQYGFHFRLKDLYMPDETYTLKLDTAVKDFAVYAAKQKVNYKILKIFNPWLRQSYLTNKSKKSYEIRLPKSGYYNFSDVDMRAIMDSLNVEKDSLDVKQGDE